jgi:hypothetical protein
LIMPHSIVGLSVMHQPLLQKLTLRNETQIDLSPINATGIPQLAYACDRTSALKAHTFPKTMSLVNVACNEVKIAVNKLNSRSRKCLSSTMV